MTEDPGHRSYDELFIGGRWRKPANPQQLAVISPHSEEPIGHAQAAGPDDVDAAVAAARHAFDHGPWPRLDPPSGWRKVEQLAAIYGGAHRRDGRPDHRGDGVAAQLQQAGPGGRRGLDDASHAGGRPRLPVGGTSPGRARRGAPAPGAGRRGRRDRAVERAAVPDHAQADSRADRRLHGDPQAGARNPVGRFVVGRDDRGGRPARRRGVGAARRIATSARRWCAIPAWTRSRSPAPAPPAAASPRSAASSSSGCSLELGGKSAAIVLDDADIGKTRAGLKMASLMNNGQACVAQTRILVSERRHDEVVDALAEMMSGLRVGDPADETTDIGPLVAATATAPGPGLHPDRAARRRARSCSAATTTPGRPRLVRPADAVRRRHQRHAHRARGDLRPGADRPALHRRGRRGPDRQRQRLRPGRFGVDRRRRPRPRDRRQVCAPAPTASTCTCSTSAPRSAASSSRASGASSARRVSTSTSSCSRWCAAASCRRY